MADIKWIEGNRIQIAPPKKTKKITGTRFATILGLNPWSTAFEIQTVNLSIVLLALTPNKH